MDQLIQMEFPETEPEESADKPQWVLTKLKPKHLDALALVAQGMKYTEIAKIVGYTPQYIWMLLQQEVAKQYLHKIAEVTGARLDALFEQSVEVIADTLKNGSEGGKLKAARLQLEATKRIGRGDTLAVITQNSDERLSRLADRLAGLVNSAQGVVIDEEGSPVQAPQVLKYVSSRPVGEDPTAQALEPEQGSLSGPV